MNFNTGVSENCVPEGPLAQMERSLMDSGPPSVALRDDNDASIVEELWAAVDDLFQEQENDFIDQDEVALLGASGPLFDTPATPVVKRLRMPMNPTLSFQRRSVVPSLVSGPSLSPTLKPHLHPLSPVWQIIPDLKIEYRPPVSPPRPHVLLPSRGASLTGQSVRASPARESPSHRFFASPDQIAALGRPRTWLHGQVVSTLGDTFCFTPHLKPRHERYNILPTDLFELWNLYMGGHIPS